MECSLLSNCLPKINQIWTHLSWAHQCHPLLNWKRNQKKNLREVTAWGGHIMDCSEKVWNMLSVQHCMPLAFSSQSIYLGSENKGSC